MNKRTRAVGRVLEKSSGTSEETSPKPEICKIITF